MKVLRLQFWIRHAAHFNVGSLEIILTYEFDSWPALSLQDQRSDQEHADTSAGCCQLGAFSSRYPPDQSINQYQEHADTSVGYCQLEAFQAGIHLINQSINIRSMQIHQLDTVNLLKQVSTWSDLIWSDQSINQSINQPTNNIMSMQIHQIHQLQAF